LCQNRTLQRYEHFSTRQAFSVHFSWADAQNHSERQHAARHEKGCPQAAGVPSPVGQAPRNGREEGQRIPRPAEDPAGMATTRFSPIAFGAFAPKEENSFFAIQKKVVSLHVQTLCTKRQRERAKLLWLTL